MAEVARSAAAARGVQVLRGPTAGLGASPAEGLSWERAVKLFLEGWAADHPGVRPATLKHYREQLVGRIASFAKAEDVDSVECFTRQDLRGFVVWLEEFETRNGRPLSPRGKQMALETARRFLMWLYQEGLLPQDLSTQVAKYRLDRDPEPRATPHTDLERALSSVSLTRTTGIRNLAMIHLMAFCGLRVGELVALNAVDLDLVVGRVRVRAETSKVRRTRFVDLPLTLVKGRELVKPEVYDLMARWLQVRSRECPHLGEDDALFVTLRKKRSAHDPKQLAQRGARGFVPGGRLTTHAVRNILIRIAANAGISRRRFTPHRLRHYFGVASARAGVPTTALMRAMGHRSPTMTARYSEFVDSERRWVFAKADITKDIAFPTTP
ncbi:MAG: site-specific integrase [Armatimonadetes bacterium]|nr:site-specific integrase [Armatimonadota bacterium]